MNKKPDKKFMVQITFKKWSAQNRAWYTYGSCQIPVTTSEFAQRMYTDICTALHSYFNWYGKGE